MLKRILLKALPLPLLCAAVAAQQPPEPAPQAKPPSGAEAPKEASAGSEAPKADEADPENPELKVLKPGDVPAELLRIGKRKNKAEIKCEVTITPPHGRPVTVKGVIRNGKLIERFAGRDFVQDPTIEHPQCGIRLWWVDNTSGWIFLRYSQIDTIALTGVLTAEEKQAIMEALQAKEKRKQEDQHAIEVAKLDEELLKMTSVELEAYLLREYPQEQGWTSEKLRELKKKQLIDNQPLTRQEAVFVTYFPTLVKARLKELKREKDKVEFEPGSAEKPAESSQPGKPPESVQPEPAQPEDSGAEQPDDEPLPEDEE
ncbi:MAG TPA: hypothetical protein VFY93_11835 [Planctomycetota bacterium]|nr:hypothetical protein [Planctomycetota bacterium]